jgi:GDP-L-fucose synthase
MNQDSRIFIAGHRGLVGSAITAYLEQQRFTRLLKRTRAELDLLDTRAVEAFFAAERPEFVFLAAAKVGGILANDTYPADFIRDNLILQTNLIEASRQAGVRRLLFLGSSCIYPRLCPQPIREEYLLTGPLEPTNRPYALAKIAGVEMCWSYNRQYGTKYLAAMPTNLYGPHDNFDLKTSHVLPALMRKVVQAKAAGRNFIEVWGTGKPRRELLYSEDMAAACVFLMQLPDSQFQTLIHTDNANEHAPLINIGTGEDVTIRELAELVARELGFDGELRFDATKPDGTPRKLLDVSRMHALGWRAKTGLAEGIRTTYAAAEAQLKS